MSKRDLYITTFRFSVHRPFGRFFWVLFGLYLD
jgi:hypothetical protein